MIDTNSLRDIPGLKFKPNGNYDLRTKDNRIAAAEACLRYIMLIPMAYSSMSPEGQRLEMVKVATDMVKLLAEARDSK